MRQRVVVVTGASAGVGRAISRAFARAGCDVALLARGEEGLKAALVEVEAEGVRNHVVPVDRVPGAADRRSDRTDRRTCGRRCQATGGAHGRFDDRATSFSVAILASRYKGVVTGAVASAAAAFVRRATRS